MSLEGEIDLDNLIKRDKEDAKKKKFHPIKKDKKEFHKKEYHHNRP